MTPIQQRKRHLRQLCEALKKADTDIIDIIQFGSSVYAPDLARDVDLLSKARRMARELLQRDPDLSCPEHHALKETLVRKWGEKFALGSIG